jgi:site-specific recombinase XerD
MRHHILPIARKLGINKRIGWHTFRHTYSTLLRSTGAELKIMQELLRHSTIRVTLDTYTQAVTTENRTAQEAVHRALLPTEKSAMIRRDAVFSPNLFLFCAFLCPCKI